MVVLAFQIVSSMSLPLHNMLNANCVHPPHSVIIVMIQLRLGSVQNARKAHFWEALKVAFLAMKDV